MLLVRPVPCLQAMQEALGLVQAGCRADSCVDIRHGPECQFAILLQLLLHAQLFLLAPLVHRLNTSPKWWIVDTNNQIELLSLDHVFVESWQQQISVTEVADQASLVLEASPLTHQRGRPRRQLPRLFCDFWPEGEPCSPCFGPPPKPGRLEHCLHLLQAASGLCKEVWKG